MRRAIAAALLLFASAASAQLVYEREITPTKGPNRLDVDAALLAGTSSDLHDLRLIDANGAEVPYLLVQPSAAAPEWQRARIVPVASTKTTSGFEADLGAVREVDRIEIDGLATPLMKHARVEGSGDRTRWNLLADATVFDLPDQNLRQREIAFAHGAYRYLRVTWDDRNSARIAGAPVAAARLYRAGNAPEPLRAPLAYTRLAPDPRMSRYRIALPRTALPLKAVEVAVAEGDVFRTATVTEPVLEGGEIRQVPIGASRLRRAVRGSLVASDLAVPISRPSGRELVLAIDTAGGAELPVTGIIAVYEPQPWIYFESADGAPLRARYGDAAAKAPQYDLEAARKFINASALGRAQWASTPVSTPARGEKASSPMPMRGAKVDRSSYRFSRAIPAGDGLVVIPLDAHVLAHTHDSAADVRVVDAQSRQIPYVLERRAEPLSIAMKVPVRSDSGSTSTYRFAMPYDTFGGDVTVMLVLTTSAGVFERTVRPVAGFDSARAREPYEMAGVTWRNTDAETPAAPLSIGPVPSGTSYVDVKIDEGDNAPLPVTSARLLLPGWALRLHDPGESLSLLYGNPDAQAPRYDLAILAPQLFTMPARELIPAAATGAADRTDTYQRTGFWIVIAAAVVILGVLLVRLLAKATPRSEHAQ